MDRLLDKFSIYPIVWISMNLRDNENTFYLNIFLKPVPQGFVDFKVFLIKTGMCFVFDGHYVLFAVRHSIRDVKEILTGHGCVSDSDWLIE